MDNNSSSEETLDNICEEPGGSKCCSDKEDEADNCVICFEPFTSSGTRKIACIPCGHIFCHQCILKWFSESVGQRRCPTCKRVFRKREIRVHYCRGVKVIDNSEIEEAKEKVDFLLKKERSLEMQLERQVQLTQQLQNQNEFLSQTVEILKEQLRNTPNVVKASSSDSVNRTLRLFLKNTVKVASDNSCRVMAYNPFIACLFVSCKSQPFFSGFSVVKLDVQSGKPVGSIACHSGPVRDVRICPDGYATFLTCSMDRNLKLCDSRNMQTAQSIYVGEPVWNCCWNASHSQFVYVGTQAGKVRMYDLRMICNQQGNEPLRDISNMQKPVVSLHWKHHPSRPESRQGLMASTVSDCELNLWSASDNSFRCHNIFFNGRVTSIQFDNMSDHFLASFGPSATFKNCHYLFGEIVERFIASDTELPIYAVSAIRQFDGGKKQTVLNRNCLFTIYDEHSQSSTFAAIYDEESQKVIQLWDMNTNRKCCQSDNAVCSSDDVVFDMCTTTLPNEAVLFALTRSNVLFYRII
ncbi:E3 ubiquitin-protein ligase RFWD3 [Trichinella spiralis]|uniref:RING-type E3 ubiquitin transferase n=1 Tax=Trichinella spiralis TaxID=6334 RepID=A0A0V1B167_TRISP|nr:E3 ubiquitin-protein ligase RFWD3 [Trichinella spiralis]